MERLQSRDEDDEEEGLRTLLVNCMPIDVRLLRHIVSMRVSNPQWEVVRQPNASSTTRCSLHSDCLRHVFYEAQVSAFSAPSSRCACLSLIPHDTADPLHGRHVSVG